jgi:hypothetical protein
LPILIDLQSTKAINFRYFCEILKLINNKAHITIEGFLRLAFLINRLNKPLSYSLLAKLVQLGPLPRVEFETSYDFSSANRLQTLNPFWISGFSAG